MQKKRLIPFKLLPGSYGLSGRVYKEAEACYYNEPGYDLDVLLARIRFEDDKSNMERQLIYIDEKYGKLSKLKADLALLKLENPDEVGIAYQKRKSEILFNHGEITEFEKDRIFARIDGGLTKEKELELSFKHGIIDEFTKDLNIANLITDEIEKTVALLEVEYKHGKIEKTEFEKRRATTRKEPWIDIIDHGYDPKKGVNGVFFEFDWNDYWIEYLELNGYVGNTEDDIVKAWFFDVNNSVEETNKVPVLEDDEN